MEQLYHDDGTMMKVFGALVEAGMTGDQAQDAIMKMQNAGIYFREARRLSYDEAIEAFKSYKK